MKKLVLLGFILATSFTANAAVVTQDVEFGTQGSSTDVAELSPLQQILTINPFDSSLGTLTDVRITVFGQIDSEGSSTNNSDENGRTDIEILLAADWLVQTIAADNHVFASANSVTPLISAQSSAPGNFDMGTGDTFNFDFGTGELSASLTNIDMSVIMGSSPIEFLFSTDARTNLFNAVAAGTGNFTNDFSTGSWGRIVAEFEYDPFVVEVVAPTIFNIFAFCALIMALYRPRNN